MSRVPTSGVRARHRAHLRPGVSEQAECLEYESPWVTDTAECHQKGLSSDSLAETRVTNPTEKES
jgi:hypothetical protein